MSPTEMASAALPGANRHKSVSALFGDDADSEPLWFKKDTFAKADFDSEAYIRDLRRFVAFDTLRTELRGHLGALKNELVELINRDYTDFVNLSTKLVDVDGAVLRMRMPLNELRARLVTVRESVHTSLAALQDGLKRRADASASREVLELLLDTSHVVSKVEKLLVELQSFPEDGAQVPAQGDSKGKVTRAYSNGNIAGDAAEHGASLEDARSRLLERIASEMNRLKFYVAQAQDLPFIQNMQPRIGNADVSLDASLRRCFEGGLERRDDTVIYHCLRAYAAIDNTAGAEEVFRSAIVAPFVQRSVPPSPARDTVGASADKLAEVFDEIEVHIQTECQFLLDKAVAANSGLHVFDFLSNSILKEVHSAIQKGKPGAFSPGKPAEFLANYKSSLKFLRFLEGYCQSPAAVAAFRSQTAYTDFMRQWNLGVYFTLRFQEIAQSLDTALSAPTPSPIHVGSSRAADGSLGLALQSSVTLWDCLQRCWKEGVYIEAVSDKFLRLTLQLLSRYTTWLSTGLAARKAGNATSHPGGEWALAAAPEDFVLVSLKTSLSYMLFLLPPCEVDITMVFDMEHYTVQLITRCVWVSVLWALQSQGNKNTTERQSRERERERERDERKSIVDVKMVFWVQMRHDVELLVGMVKGSYMDHVLPLLSGNNSEEVCEVVRQSLLQGAEALLAIVPALSDVLTEALTEKCVEVLRQVKGIIATYRMTNRPLPSRHSPYVTSVLQPLKTFVEDERFAHLTKEMRAELILSVSEKITVTYDVLARDMVSVARTTESSLQRLRRGARQRGAGAGTETNDNNISDNLSDKICAQLFLDVQEYGRRLAALGIAAADMTAYTSLWQCVAPPDRQNVVEF